MYSCSSTLSQISLKNSIGKMIFQSINSYYICWVIQILFLVIFGQSSIHPLLDDRWLAHSTITLGSCVLSCVNLCVYTTSDVPLLYTNAIYAVWWVPRVVDFGFLGWNIYFQEGCHFSDNTSKMMQKYFWKIIPAKKVQKWHNLLRMRIKDVISFMICLSSMVS